MSPTARFRLFFSLEYAGIGILMPYLALYLASIGLSGTQIGGLLALGPLIAFLVQPVWGLVTDIYHLHRRALVLACFGAAAAIAAFAATADYRLLLVLYALHAVMRAPVAILGTSLALEHLEQNGQRDTFGGIRLWGSIGFAVTSFGIGAWLVDRAIWWILPLYSLSYLVLGLIGLTLPDAEVHGDVRWREGLSLLRLKPALTVFLVGALLIGTTLGIVNNYLAVYLRDIAAPGWVIGTALAISALFEVPLMARVPAFLRRWGFRIVFIGGVGALPLRWILYTFIENPYLVLPTQVLHSIGMMALLVVAVLYVDRILPARWRASGQALYAASLYGIGPSIGLALAGTIYESAGIRLVWVLCVVTATIGTALLAVVVRRQPESQPLEEVPA